MKFGLDVHFSRNNHQENPHQNSDWNTFLFQKKMFSIMSYFYASAKWRLYITKSLYCSTSFEFVLTLFKGLRTCLFICSVLCGLGPLVSLQNITNTCRRIGFSINLKADSTYHIEPDFELFFINSCSYLRRHICNPTRHMWRSFFVKIFYGSKLWIKSAKRARS